MHLSKIDSLMDAVLSNPSLTNEQLMRMAGRIGVAMQSRGLSEADSRLSL